MEVGLIIVLAIVIGLMVFAIKGKNDGYKNGGYIKPTPPIPSPPPTPISDVVKKQQEEISIKKVVTPLYQYREKVNIWKCPVCEVENVNGRENCELCGWRKSG